MLKILKEMLGIFPNSEKVVERISNQVKENSKLDSVYQSILEYSKKNNNEKLLQSYYILLKELNKQQMSSEDFIIYKNLYYLTKPKTQDSFYQLALKNIEKEIAFMEERFKANNLQNQLFNVEISSLNSKLNSEQKIITNFKVS